MSSVWIEASTGPRFLGGPDRTTLAHLVDVTPQRIGEIWICACGYMTTQERATVLSRPPVKLRRCKSCQRLHERRTAHERRAKRRAKRNGHVATFSDSNSIECITCDGHGTVSGPKNLANESHFHAK